MPSIRPVLLSFAKQRTLRFSIPLYVNGTVEALIVANFAAKSIVDEVNSDFHHNSGFSARRWRAKRQAARQAKTITKSGRFGEESVFEGDFSLDIDFGFWARRYREGYEDEIEYRHRSGKIRVERSPTFEML